MLLEFRVSNYRSIKDEQVFSLVSQDKDQSLWEGNVYPTGNAQVPNVLRGAVVYGPNASGKSNLIRAMSVMQAIIRDSATLVQAGQTLNVQPFAFDENSIQEPSVFEATVLVDKVRYQYGFSLTQQRIHDEWLLVYKSAKPQEWFTRTWHPEKNEYGYDFSKTYFTGNKEVWKQNTRDNALFLSTAVLLNNEQLRPLWDWFVNRWVFFLPGALLPIDMTVSQFGRPEEKAKVLGFVNSADFGIEDVELRPQVVKQTNIQFDFATGQNKVLESRDSKQVMPYFVHNGDKGSGTLAIFDESLGTQKSFALAGIVLHILKTGTLFVVDELENSLHPLLIRHIVAMFQSPQLNTRGAQLVFSTHNTSLMDKALFRRDQIWFTDKGKDLATVLFPLIDFQGARSNESFEKRYLDGRYGAIPIIDDFVETPGSGHEHE